LLKMSFENGYDCGFAHRVYQIVPGSTHVKWGLGEEFCYSTTDGDGDGVPDAHDNCPNRPNTGQENSDGDMFGDTCDICPNDFNESTGYYCAPALVQTNVQQMMTAHIER